MDGRISRRLVARLLDWFGQNARNLPWRRTRDPYAIWVSEIMLQQTQVKTVVPYFERLMRELPTIESVANASSEKIHKLWEGLGYYTRVRNMQKAACAIVEQHDGKFPRRFEDVLALPGIGRYTAGAICSIAFNQPTPILDGNVIRVLTRVYGIRENPGQPKTNARLWSLAEELVRTASSVFLEPENGRARCPHRADSRSNNDPVVASHARRGEDTAPHLSGPCSALNQSLMELGATICTPRQPQCGYCPIRRHCVANQQHSVESLPNLGKRIPATSRRFVAFVLERNGQFLVQQRSAGIVNAYLWEFPNVKLSGGKSFRSAATELFGDFPGTLKRLCTIRHCITRYRITVEAFRGSASSMFKSNGSALWLSIRELDLLAFTSAHRKILRALLSDEPLS